MSDTAGYDRKTENKANSSGKGGMYETNPPAHAVHGHGHVGRGRDGKAPGDPHKGDSEAEAVENYEYSKGKKEMGEGAEGSNSSDSAQATSQY